MDEAGGDGVGDQKEGKKPKFASMIARLRKATDEELEARSKGEHRVGVALLWSVVT